MKLAYSYQRWSTKLQGAETKDSRIRQTSSAKRWIDNQSQYTLADEAFIDAGVSAFKGKNFERDDYGRAKGELERFIQLYENGTIKKGSILLIDEFSRFSRLKPSMSLGLFIRVICTVGIGIVFTGSYETRIITADLIDREPPILQMIIGELVRSYRESEEKSRKVKEALKRKYDRLKNGEIVPHNNVPKYLSFDEKTKTYVHNANTVLVQRMAKDFLDGNSIYSIAKKFNDEGVKTFRRGFQWSAKSCRVILGNRILIGEFLGNKKFCVPMIDKDDFDKIQAMLAKNTWTVKGREGKHLINIFRGLAKCSECGKSMGINHQVINNVTKKPLAVPYRYLVCSSHSTAQNCSNKKYIHASHIEHEFFVEFLMKTPGGLIAVNNGDVKRIQREIAIEETKRATIEKQIEKLAVANEELRLEQLTKQLTRLKSDLDKVVQKIDFLSMDLRQVQGTPTNFGDVRKLVTGFTKHARQYDDAVNHVMDALEDNEVRKKVRTLLPTLIGGVKVYAQEGFNGNGAFQVLDRQGRVLYDNLDMQMAKAS